MSLRLVVAGGGTGGHVLAGVAIADAWCKAHSVQADDILFVGARGGLEERLVPKSGYTLTLLPIGTLNRVGMSQRLRTLIKLPFALTKSAWVLLRFRPHAVLGVGGYASGPLVLVARILIMLRLIPTKKTAILEQNSVPGMTNRILGRWVHHVFCAFPGSDALFSKKKVLVTGNPVRSRLVRMKSAIRTPFTIFIFGGSQGAVGINSLILAALPLLKSELSSCRIIHQTGPRDFERVKAGYDALGVSAEIHPFIDAIGEVYQKASLLICRSGSSTLSEIASIGRAAILIPFPEASDNHQEKNALVFSNANAAILFSQKSGTGESLAECVRQLMRNPSAIESMEKRVVDFDRPDAAQNIVRTLST